MKKIIGRSSLLIVIITLSITLSAFAHSGRTDSKGGHKDNKNASGLGAYHYHHGYGPHLHTNGCIYETGSLEFNSEVGTEKRKKRDDFVYKGVGVMALVGGGYYIYSKSKGK